MNSPQAWVLFNLFLLALLAIDLGLFHRRSRVLRVSEALAWSAVWIGLAVSFNVALYFLRGPQSALEFLTGYLLEKSLSVDNLFVFAVIFGAFGVAEAYQRKVLFWGILGALAMRGLLIAAGVTLVRHVHGILYVFGAILLVGALRLALARDRAPDPRKNLVLRLARRFFRVAPDYDGPRFFARIGGLIHATPLFLVLLVVEATDLVFAVDSIPAVMAVTNDPFLVYTSNAFAILGLRSLYFALSAMLGMCRYLKFGLAAILGFVGAKMMLSGVWTVPVWATLAFVVVALSASVGLSFLRLAYRRAEVPADQVETSGAFEDREPVMSGSTISDGL